MAVGTVGMDIERKAYYEKELDFRISRSYGPGRYDAAYEQKGRDYPIGYVRWTETRNMEAFVQFLAEKKVDVGALITHRFSIERAQSAYDLITGKSREPFLGVVIQYAGGEDESPALTVVPERATVAPRPACRNGCFRRIARRRSLCRGHAGSRDEGVVQYHAGRGLRGQRDRTRNMSSASSVSDIAPPTKLNSFRTRASTRW